MLSRCSILCTLCTLDTKKKPTSVPHTRTTTVAGFLFICFCFAFLAVLLVERNQSSQNYSEGYYSAMEKVVFIEIPKTGAEEVMGPLFQSMASKNGFGIFKYKSRSSSSNDDEENKKEQVSGRASLTRGALTKQMRCSCPLDDVRHRGGQHPGAVVDLRTNRLHEPFADFIRQSWTGVRVTHHWSSDYIQSKLNYPFIAHTFSMSPSKFHVEEEEVTGGNLWCNGRKTISVTKKSNIACHIFVGSIFFTIFFLKFTPPFERPPQDWSTHPRQLPWPIV